MPRLFNGLDLPQNIKSGLEWISNGIPHIRWAEPQQMHITLRFIGETDGASVMEIDEALSEVKCPPLMLSLQGIGHFPARGKPRVLWVGVSQVPQLLQLEKAIRKSLDQLELADDPRSFHPHVTLGRFDDDVSLPHVAQFMATHSALSSPEFRIEAFHLYSSTRTPKGSRYTVERTYPLEEPWPWEKHRK